MSALDLLRLGLFVGVLAAALTWQVLAPARVAIGRTGKRWLVNGALLLASQGVARWLAPLAAVSAAAWAQTHQIGLARWWAAPSWAEVALCWILLDLAIYAQHRAMHEAPWLWRFHAVHHADAHVDATTALRFHPGEIVISMLWKSAIVIAVGAPIWAVAAFEAAVNALALFNHANGRLPRPLEAALKPWLITPALHRLHHDAAAGAAAANYGFSVSLWDRLFASFADRPEPEQLGLRAPPGDPESLAAMFAAPFTSRRDAVRDPSGRPGPRGDDAGG